MKKYTFYFAIIVGTLLILVTLLSLLYNVQLWFLKVLDFPRLQTLIGLLVCMALFVWLNRTWRYPAVLFSAGLVVSIILQSTYIVPYTPLAGKAVPSGKKTEQNTLKLMVANVWMKNNKADTFLNIVREANPDVLLVMETNEWWNNQLSGLQSVYPYKVLYPLDNTYGMLLYSKYKLENPQVKFLKHKRVPSIHSNVIFPNGKKFRLYAMHPVPPVPSKHPDNIGGKEVELIKVGRMVKNRDLPVVVAGDFNDVAWSRTSRLFGTESRLADVRVGRGLYNTFDAKSFLLRWPLDHIFVSNEFGVADVQRLPKFGSDHFPIMATLTLPE